jgi:hypothetical protein
MANPSREHHVALKHVLHYLHGTRSKGITYHNYDAHGINQLYAFCDADYAGDTASRKSRSAYLMMMNSGCISWKTKLQTVVANSTTDAEVYSATMAIKEIVYLRDALRRIGLPQATKLAPNKGTILYEDNQATTAIARSAAHREATKHMAIARAFLRYHQENGTISIMDCYTHMQLADFMTKALGPQQFETLAHEAMGFEAKRDLSKYARKNWREDYDDKMKQKQEMCFANMQDQHTEEKQRVPSGAQGGMLKSMFVDLIYTNCMRVDTRVIGSNYVICDSIEEYMRYEQHRSHVVEQVTAEDMKVENKYYGNAILLNRICTNT